MTTEIIGTAEVEPLRVGGVVAAGRIGGHKGRLLDIDRARAALRERVTT